MADISFNIARKELKIAQIAQLYQLFRLLHLIHIQLFRERLSEKSAHDNPERYCGWFWVYCSSKKFERMAREAMDISLLVLKKKTTKVGSTATVVRNSVLVISHIAIRDCRVHTFFRQLFLNRCIQPRLLWVKSYANEEKCKQWRQQRFAYTHTCQLSRIQHQSPALPYGSPYLPDKIIFWAFLCLDFKFSSFLVQNLNFSYSQYGFWGTFARI